MFLASCFSVQIIQIMEGMRLLIPGAVISFLVIEYREYFINARPSNLI